eukprot:g6132.t1
MERDQDIEVEVGHLLRGESFNSAKRRHNTPRSIDTLSLRQLYEIKHGTRNTSLNAKVLTELYKKRNDLDTKSDDAFLEFVHLTKQQLPKLKTASEIFVAFHEQLESLFPPLIHIRYRTLSDTSNSLHFSISLFPPDFTTESHRSKCSAASVSNFNDRVVPTSSSKAKEEPILVEFVNKVIAFNSERKLHWSNCCVFNLVKSRGPVVQTPPSWSVGCTAAYHAAYIKGDLIHSRDYEKLGPHFVDWEELRNKKEAKSMIAVPLYASKKKPRAVLGMASTEKNTFKW